MKLPDKDDNTYEPVKKVLESSAEGFVQGMRGSVDQKVTVPSGGLQKIYLPWVSALKGPDADNFGAAVAMTA